MLFKIMFRVIFSVMLITWVSSFWNSMNQSQAYELSSVSTVGQELDHLHLWPDEENDRLKRSSEDIHHSKRHAVEKSLTKQNVDNKKSMANNTSPKPVKYAYGPSVWDVTLWKGTQSSCCDLIGCPLHEKTTRFQENLIFTRISCYCADEFCHGGFIYPYWIFHPNF
ncbi:uncharacterized protein LOC106642380 isoform X1 [Copidosoma floridanum]|uniref:uncharacterized protein LOC106642380 isoform X1 n=1 Tax=Copidosoma floridanum TaxID=29053 RepID=UPI0006C96DBD|nr:uncharacterized protein LOC106642380 isoform X1 [Copidosoma floridanum]